MLDLLALLQKSRSVRGYDPCRRMTSWDWEKRTYVMLVFALETSLLHTVPNE